MRTGEEHVDEYKLDTLRLLGSVGEPINPGTSMVPPQNRAKSSALSSILGGKQKLAA
jgi:acyl-coenzyme A synthetase/AMP-(fatty) acid ligase